MRFDELVRLAGQLPVVESATLLALGEEAKSLSVQLSRWVRSGKLIQLRRGVYLLPPHLRRAPAPPETIANLLVTPSYVSLERALSLHGLIPEAVPLVQSVTTARGADFATPAGDFEFRHVDPRLFFGFAEMPVAEGRALVALPEKALLDRLYLARGSFSRERLRELRLQDLARLDLTLLDRMAERTRSPRLRRAVPWIRELAADEARS
jgi:predicted transcriptional regulator of viral defense system